MLTPNRQDGLDRSTGWRICLDDAVGERRELVVVTPMAHHDELVAADARDEIVTARIGLDDLRGMHQHGVAGGVAERVVDLLEAVEVEVQQRRAAARFADIRPASRRDSGGWAGRSANRAARCARCAPWPASSSAFFDSVNWRSRMRFSLSSTSLVTSHSAPIIFGVPSMSWKKLARVRTWRTVPSGRRSRYCEE